MVVPLVRLAQIDGFKTGQIMATQYLVATVALSIGCLLFSRVSIGWKDTLKLLGVGVVSSGVSFCYFQALERISPAMSLTLLFQFVWMGLVVQAVRTRTVPRLSTVITVLLVVVGAVLATGFLDEGFTSGGLDLVGVLFGFLSAVCYTAYLVLNSHVATHKPALNRGMFVALGSMIVSFSITPQYFAEPLIVINPLLSLGLGLAGTLVPIVLTAWSAPKLPSGLMTVMASSELPSGVLCAAVFLGEPVSLTIGIGVAIVLFGIVASEMETLRSLRNRGKAGFTSRRE